MRDGWLGRWCGIMSMLMVFAGCNTTSPPTNPIMPPTVMILPSPTVGSNPSLPLVSSPAVDETSPIPKINDRRQQFGRVLLLPPTGWLVTYTQFLDSDLLLMSPAHSEHPSPPIISLSVGPAPDLLGYQPADESLDGLMDAVVTVRDDAHIIERHPILIGGVAGQMATLTLEESIWGGARSGHVVVAWLPDRRMVELMSDMPVAVEMEEQLLELLITSVEFL